MGFYIDNNSFWNCLIKEPIVHFCYQQIKLLSKVFGFCRHVLKCGWSYGLPSPWSPSWLTMRKDKLDHKVLTCHTQTLVTKREKKFLHPTPLRWEFNLIFSARLLGIFDYFGGKSVEVTGNLRKLFLTSFGRAAKRSSRKLVSYFGPSKFSQLLLISLFSSMMKALKEEPLVCHSPPQLIRTTLVEESILTMIWDNCTVPSVASKMKSGWNAATMPIPPWWSRTPLFMRCQTTIGLIVPEVL